MYLVKEASDIFVANWDEFDVLSELLNVFVADKQNGCWKVNLCIVVNSKILCLDIDKYGNFKNSVNNTFLEFLKSKNLSESKFSYSGIVYNPDVKKFFVVFSDRKNYLDIMRNFFGENSYIFIKEEV